MKKKLISLVLTLCFITTLFCISALADGTTREVGSEAALKAAVENAASGDTIKLTDSFNLTASITMPSSSDKTKELTLDLNGKTLDTASKRITVSGQLTIMDSVSGGGITGDEQVLRMSSGDSTLTLDGADVVSRGSNAIYIYSRNNAKFIMNGGSVSATGNAVNLYYGHAEIKSGTITGGNGSNYGINISSSATSENTSLTIGVAGGEQDSVQISSIYGRSSVPITFNCGIIGSAKGRVALDVSNGLFETNIEDYLKAGYMCVETQYNGKTYYQAVELTEDNAGAKIGDTLYASASAAAGELGDGQTLTLLKDLVIDKKGAAIAVEALNAVVDLNGFSVTNTNPEGEGVSMKNPYGSNVNSTGAIKNGSDKASAITAGVPVAFSSGDSRYSMTGVLEGDIELISTNSGEDKANISLGSGALLAYSEDAVRIMGNGGFKAVDSEGKAYIFGSANSALSKDADGTVELLNNYVGTESITLHKGTGIVDLNDFTYTVTLSAGGNNAIIKMITEAETNLTIKNGTLVARHCDGAVILNSDATLTLDNVDMSFGGAYGFVCNGTYTGNNLNLIDSTVTATGDYGLAVYWPSGGGMVTIDNSKIYAHTGVQICAGGLIVKGENTEIIANGSPVAKQEEDGGILDGAAISIIDREGYQELSEAKIEGGVFESRAESEAVKAYSFNNDNKTEDEWSEVGNVVEVTGGNFSSSVPADLLADNLTAELYDTGVNPDAPFSYYADAEAASEAATSEGIVAVIKGDEAKYNVTLDYGNGRNQTLNGSSVILSSPVREGYSFLGWYDAAGNRYVGSYTPTADVTLTARWSEIVIPDPNPITITQPANGTVSTNFSNASVGATITVTATPNSGYELAYITVNGEKIEGNTFTMPDAAVTVSAVFIPATGGFADVIPGAWYVDAVNYVVANGLMEGTSATTFEPDAQMTRAMFWTILTRIDGETITGSTWAADARTWAMANGVSDGTNPHAPLTREQLVTMLWRYLGEPSTTGTLTAYTDAASVSDWAKTAMAWAIEKGIITGVTATTLAPQSIATRAQCATILMRNAF